MILTLTGLNSKGNRLASFRSLCYITMEVKNMRYVYPDHYDSFQCLADKCRQSCCVGWEIDIDRDSMEYYAAVEGSVGDKLRQCIGKEPEPHFILGEDERCPLLNDRGLCELILELGDASLCDICTEHPRFYNEFSGRCEYGVGMCCEAAAELLLDGTEHLSFICEDDGENEPEAEAAVFELRDKIFDILYADGPFTDRMSSAAKLAGIGLPEADLNSWADFLLSLERLDEKWTEKLEGLRSWDASQVNEELNDIRYERIAAYFLFRYLASASVEKRGAVLCLAFLAAEVICALDLRFGRDSEHLRLFSSEIEYSDENVDRILDYFL